MDNNQQNQGRQDQDRRQGNSNLGNEKNKGGQSGQQQGVNRELNEDESTDNQRTGRQQSDDNRQRTSDPAAPQELNRHGDQTRSSEKAQERNTGRGENQQEEDLES